MKIKYMGHSDFFKTFSRKMKRIETIEMTGYVTLVKIEEVHHPFIIGETRLYDDGYSVIHFLPDGEHWYLQTFYNECGEIIEWYFDITLKNAVDQAGNPYCVDLYLDVVLLPDGKIMILDEDELKKALDDHKIRQADFDLAYATLDLLKSKFLNVSYMTAFCHQLRSLFE